MTSSQTYANVLDTGALDNSIEVGETYRQIVPVELSGEFDLDELDILRSALDGAMRAGRTVCADLSGVTFLDILCARELVERTCFHGGRLVIRSLSRQARASLEACVLEEPGFWSVAGSGTGE